MGAAGRDFHNFNVAFREDPACEVVAFTAAQIPVDLGALGADFLLAAGDISAEAVPLDLSRGVHRERAGTLEPELALESEGESVSAGAKIPQ